MPDQPIGNALVGQSGGPTVVINQSLAGIITEASRNSKITNIYGALHGVKGILQEDFIDLKRESRETVERVAKTPCAGLGSVRKKPSEEECARIFEVFRAHNIRYFYYIGGNDSAETAHIISQISQREKYDLHLYHVPKTIDNDLMVTDHCPGYGSAAKFVAQAFQGDNQDNRSLPGIKINIVMGRHAGFLTAASLLARQREDDGPHLIYLPEVDFDVAGFLNDVAAMFEDYGRCLIAVSEGIHDEQGKTILPTREKDSHGNVQLSGSGALGDYLAEQIRSAFGKELRVRADTFGYLQRSFAGMVSEIDAAEARRVGEDAVRFSTSKMGSASVALRRTSTGAKYACENFVTPLETVAKKTRKVDAKYIEHKNNVSASFLDYVAPLVGSLPEIGALQRFSVTKMS